MMTNSAALPAQGALPQVLVEALRHVGTQQHPESAVGRPYQLPSAAQPHRARVLAELDALVLTAHESTPAVTRILGPVQPVSVYAYLVAREAELDFPDAACVLLASAVLSIEDAHVIVQAAPEADLLGLKRQIVLSCLTDDDVVRAHTEAEACGEWAWVAYRDIADRHAGLGEVEEFFALWRKLAARANRHQMGMLKGKLVRGVAASSGWRAALDLTADKRIGPGYRYQAFLPSADSGDVEMLLEVLAGDAKGELDELSELLLLVRAVVADSPARPAQDHYRVPELVVRLTAIDPTTDKPTMRERDALLAGLWPALGDPATLKSIRRLVRTPMLRRELTVLPRDSH